VARGGTAVRPAARRFAANSPFFHTEGLSGRPLSAPGTPGRSGGVVRLNQHLVDERLKLGCRGVGDTTSLLRLHPSLVEGT
jgi:hypothetical protein